MINNYSAAAPAAPAKMDSRVYCGNRLSSLLSRQVQVVLRTRFQVFRVKLHHDVLLHPTQTDFECH